jgi:hypothetical protein
MGFVAEIHRIARRGIAAFRAPEIQLPPLTPAPLVIIRRCPVHAGVDTEAVANKLILGKPAT